MVRWRAIENRVPMLYISNNGETMFIDPLGDKMGEALSLFEQDSLSRTIVLQRHFSIYREYKEWVHLGAGCLFLIMLLLAQRYGHVFSTPKSSV
jgi:apolipoprotein N-acyltransferase